MEGGGNMKVYYHFSNWIKLILLLSKVQKKKRERADFVKNEVPKNEKYTF